MQTPITWSGARGKFRGLIALSAIVPALLITLPILTRSGKNPGSAAPGIATGESRKKDRAMTSVLAGDAATLSRPDLASALDQLEEAFRNDPKNFEDIVIQAASELASTDPAEAFQFLSRFHGSKALSKAKRRIVLDWCDQGTVDTMLATVKDRAGTPLLIPFLVSIGQQERPRIFDELLEKMKTPASADNRESRISIAESMVELCHPQNRVAIGARLAATDEFRPHATALLVKQARDQPDQTIQLLGSGDFLALGDEDVGDILRAVGEADPEFACGLLDRAELDQILLDRLPADTRSDGVVDRGINNLLLGVLASDPERVIDHSAALADRSIAENLRQRAVELSNSRRN